MRLHFGEDFWTSGGLRPFDVAINSTQVLHNFDPYNAAGGAFKAVIEEFTTPADGSGDIVIDFSSPSSDRFATRHDNWWRNTGDDDCGKCDASSRRVECRSGTCGMQQSVEWCRACWEAAYREKTGGDLFDRISGLSGF